jgi:hypothetical protein
MPTLGVHGSGRQPLMGWRPCLPTGAAAGGLSLRVPAGIPTAGLGAAQLDAVFTVWTIIQSKQAREQVHQRKPGRAAGAAVAGFTTRKGITAVAAGATVTGDVDAQPAAGAAAAAVTTVGAIGEQGTAVAAGAAVTAVSGAAEEPSSRTAVAAVAAGVGGVEVGVVELVGDVGGFVITDRVAGAIEGAGNLLWVDVITVCQSIGDVVVALEGRDDLTGADTVAVVVEGGFDIAFANVVVGAESAQCIGGIARIRLVEPDTAVAQRRRDAVRRELVIAAGSTQRVGGVAGSRLVELDTAVVQGRCDVVCVDGAAAEINVVTAD